MKALKAAGPESKRKEFIGFENSAFFRKFW